MKKKKYYASIASSNNKKTIARRCSNNTFFAVWIQYHIEHNEPKKKTVHGTGRKAKSARHKRRRRKQHQNHYHNNKSDKQRTANARRHSARVCRGRGKTRGRARDEFTNSTVPQRTSTVVLCVECADTEENWNRRDTRVEWRDHYDDDEKFARLWRLLYSWSEAATAAAKKSWFILKLIQHSNKLYIDALAESASAVPSVLRLLYVYNFVVVDRFFFPSIVSYLVCLSWRIYVLQPYDKLL